MEEFNKFLGLLVSSVNGALERRGLKWFIFIYPADLN